ncbi:hypothetical protein IHE45_06G058900 [Dioscorea alata]|uniref:Uncharacterized protein n=1 Tax=Dioscorea alata TaxID=55571 RepID=A0ACB7VXI8_DIOAL|nr:hypothetical protein IHE45_06G058900 [Dioscorea alata]
MAKQNLIKEANDLQRSARHLMGQISAVEISEVYFNAGLKYLHGAYLSEIDQPKGSSQSEKLKTIQAYKSASALFKLCGEIGEKHWRADLSALAFKCMEVSQFRIVYNMQEFKSMKIREERKMTSSVEHLKYLNSNPFALKDLLNTVEAMDIAMDASRRSQSALKEVSQKRKRNEINENLDSIKRVLDFSFNDVPHFVSLVRVSLNKIYI